MVDSDPHTGHATVQSADSRGGENVFQVLAHNASDRTLGQLGTTAIGCGVNAVFIWFRYPSLSWLAAGFAACSAYGIWGLLDRALVAAEARGFFGRDRAELLQRAQRVVMIAGTGAAAWALFRFMASALGGWQH